MNNNAWGRGRPKRCWSRRAENITHPCLPPSPGKRAPCSHPFNNLTGFRIITRLVAPHNVTFQQTIYILYIYISILRFVKHLLAYRPLPIRTPYRTYACSTFYAALLPINTRTCYKFNNWSIYLGESTYCKPTYLSIYAMRWFWSTDGC